MISFPARWAQHVGENLLTAYPAQGGGRFRYFERWRPVTDFAAIVERLLSGDPSFRSSSMSEMVPIVTREGEYGSWIAISGTREYSPARRYVGAVFLDEFVAVLDTLAVVPAQFEELARLSETFIRSACFRLGQRPRQFLYRPPPGWQALPSGLVANWYPQNFPANRTNIVVSPALPTQQALDEIVAEYQASYGEELEQLQIENRPITSASGSTGRALSVSGRRSDRPESVQREVVLFVIEGYLYLMRMESFSASEAPSMRRVFRDLVLSFRPLPSAHERRCGVAFSPLSAEASEPWAD